MTAPGSLEHFRQVQAAHVPFYLGSRFCRCGANIGAGMDADIRAHLAHVWRTWPMPDGA